MSCLPCLALPPRPEYLGRGGSRGIEMKISIDSLSLSLRPRQCYGTTHPYLRGRPRLLFPSFCHPAREAPGTFLDRRGSARTLRKLFLAREHPWESKGRWVTSASKSLWFAPPLHERERACLVSQAKPWSRLTMMDKCLHHGFYDGGICTT